MATDKKNPLSPPGAGLPPAPLPPLSPPTVSSARSAGTVSCTKTLSKSGTENTYACSFCNPTDRALRNPRLGCTNFGAAKSPSNISYTSPYCYVSAPKQINAQACSTFSFRAPTNIIDPIFDFDDSPVPSTVQTPTEGNNEAPEAGVPLCLSLSAVAFASRALTATLRRIAVSHLSSLLMWS